MSAVRLKSASLLGAALVIALTGGAVGQGRYYGDL